MGSGTEEIYSESLYGHKHFGTSSLRSLRRGQYKYIEAPKPELYDLSQDPGETRNLYAGRKSLAITLRERLLSLRSRFPPVAARDSQAVSSGVIEQLNSLGYVATSGAHTGSADSGLDPKRHRAHRGAAHACRNRR